MDSQINGSTVEALVYLTNSNKQLKEENESLKQTVRNQAAVIQAAYNTIEKLKENIDEKERKIKSLEEFQEDQIRLEPVQDEDEQQLQLPSSHTVEEIRVPQRQTKPKERKSFRKKSSSKKLSVTTRRKAARQSQSKVQKRKFWFGCKNDGINSELTVFGELGRVIAVFNRKDSYWLARCDVENPETLENDETFEIEWCEKTAKRRFNVARNYEMVTSDVVLDWEVSYSVVDSDTFTITEHEHRSLAKLFGETRKKQDEQNGQKDDGDEFSDLDSDVYTMND